MVAERPPFGPSEYFHLEDSSQRPPKEDGTTCVNQLTEWLMDWVDNVRGDAGYAVLRQEGRPGAAVLSLEYYGGSGR